MDPISNMIIMIKNANHAGKDTVAFPYSKLKNAIAVCLEKEGYISSISKRAKKGIPMLELGLVYVDKNPKIMGVERVSKQSRKVYYGIKNIYPVKSGQGLLVLSTPKGILTGKDARKEHTGGEALFKIW